MKELIVALLIGLLLTACQTTADTGVYRPGLTISPMADSIANDPANPPRLACGTAGGRTSCVWY